jgi:hypothetical protein
MACARDPGWLAGGYPEPRAWRAERWQAVTPGGGSHRRRAML